MHNTLKKAERLDRKKVIGKMFTGGAGARSFAVFPLRVIYLMEPELKPQASILISVSKRYFKHAVDRNRVKRQLREAYRHHRHQLADNVPDCQSIKMAFIWLSDQHFPSAAVDNRVRSLLTRIAKQL